MRKKLKFQVPAQGPVSALLDVPEKPFACLVFAHGAGAGMEHSAMASLAESLHTQGIATLRFQFPYMEKKTKRPDSPKIAVSAITAAIETAAKQLPKLPLFAGGKSFGGRMTTTAASLGELSKVQGIICFSFPLHPPKEPGLKRAEHLKALKLPTLWLQGDRDALATLPLVRKVVKSHPKIELHVIKGADHSYGVLKSSGRTPAQVLEEVAVTTKAFCLEVLS